MKSDEGGWRHSNSLKGINQKHTLAEIEFAKPKVKNEKLAYPLCNVANKNTTEGVTKWLVCKIKDDATWVRGNRCQKQREQDLYWPGLRHLCLPLQLRSP